MILKLVLFYKLLVSMVSGVLRHEIRQCHRNSVICPLRGRVIVVNFSGVIPALVRRVYSSARCKGYRVLVRDARPTRRVHDGVRARLSTGGRGEVIILHTQHSSVRRLRGLCAAGTHRMFLVKREGRRSRSSLGVSYLGGVISVRGQYGGYSLVPFAILFRCRAAFTTFRLASLSTR